MPNKLFSNESSLTTRWVRVNSWQADSFEILVREVQDLIHHSRSHSDTVVLRALVRWWEDAAATNRGNVFFLRRTIAKMQSVVMRAGRIHHTSLRSCMGGMVGMVGIEYTANTVKQPNTILHHVLINLAVPLVSFSGEPSENQLKKNNGFPKNKLSAHRVRSILRVELLSSARKMFFSLEEGPTKIIL